MSGSDKGLPLGPNDGMQEGMPTPDLDVVLEEYLFRTERDTDSEVNHTVRLEKWQRQTMKNIGEERNENTNIIEIMARAYPIGVTIMRDRYYDRVTELSELSSKVREGVQWVADYDMELSDSLIDDLDEHQISEPYDSTLCDDGQYIRVEDSFFSEAVNAYGDGGAELGGWLHRFILTVGISTSEHLTAGEEARIDKRIDSFEETIEEYRYHLESTFVKLLSGGLSIWAMEGIDKEYFELLDSVPDLMETEKIDRALYYLERIDRDAEKLE